MVKLLKLWAIVFSLFLLSPGAAASAGLTVGLWPADGYQTWRISFPADGSSELYYPHTSTYLTAAYENDLPHNAKLRIEGGLASTIKAATGSDSDWDYARSSSLWYYGEFKTAGSSGFVNIDWVKPAGKSAEYFLGYGYRRNNYRMTDGLYYIDNYIAHNPPNTLGSLDSTYSAVYQGPHIGIAGKSAISPRVSVVGSLAYTPLALFQGYGWWNLRSLNFEHTGAGQMVDAQIGLRFTPAGLKNGAVTAGYRYQRMSLYQGTENTSSEISWDKATNVQKGFYFTSEFRF